VPSSTSEAPLDVTATVQPETPVYKRWYFWVGVAAVVAAGVGVGVAVSQANAKPTDLSQQDFKDYCTSSGKCAPKFDQCINVSCNALRASASGISF
jgi:hypothetical protein